ncbi:hypothetical protein HD554DRAFT_2038290 [Boletus coccyginus]|nr:hypothetical protein HD554DRAFT_2038290 [Boletus coccyginus]
MSGSQELRRVKSTFFRTGGFKHRSGFRKSSRSIVVFTSTQTWRGKTKYQEVDETPHYELDEKKEEIPRRRKIPKTLSGLEFLQATSAIFQDFPEALDNDQSAWIPRKTKELVDLYGVCLVLVTMHGHGGDTCPLSGDGPGEQFTVVDSAGIFAHTMKWCRCCLFPSTIIKPQTGFTFDVLDEFLIDELECKTSASSFYSKLRRLTNNAFPDFLPHVLNQGLICLMGGLENMIALWYVVDDNFTAQHMKMCKPEDDVALSDGLAYMVANRPYENYVSKAADNEERSSYQNHRPVNNVNTSKSHLHATGVGATACACHGCFVPYSVVDFYKGEQHKNINYSICQAISYKSQDIQKAVIIYDVAWAGNVDGEILETLWAPFNKISSSARSMTLAHCQELYDHMRDSIWKKLLTLNGSKVFVEEIQMTQGLYEDFSASLDPS